MSEEDGDSYLEVCLDGGRLSVAVPDSVDPYRVVALVKELAQDCADSAITGDRCRARDEDGSRCKEESGHALDHSWEEESPTGMDEG